MKHNIELRIIIIDKTARPLSAIKIESNSYLIDDIAIINKSPPKIKLPIDDKVNLLEVLRQGKKVIICDKCFKIFGYKEYNNWKCPEC